MWSITVKLNWNKTAGPFLIFPLGGFHAIGNTNHVISSSWREGFFFFVTEEKRAGVFFFRLLSYFIFLSVCDGFLPTTCWFQTRHAFSPCCASFFSVQNKFCFAPSDYRRDLGGKKQTRNIKRGTNVWGKPVSHIHQRLYKPVYSNCDLLVTNWGEDIYQNTQVQGYQFAKDCFFFF